MAVRTIVTIRDGSAGIRDMNFYLRTFGSGTHNFVRTGSSARLYLRDDRDLALLENQFRPMIMQVDRPLGSRGGDGKFLSTPPPGGRHHN